MQAIDFVDLETGGLDPVRHDITQIAMILDVAGEVREELNLLVRPDPKRVEAGALAVQKKTLEQVLAHPLSQKDAFEAVRAKLDSWKSAHGMLVWGGQHAEFDVKFLKALFQTHGDPGGLARYFIAQTIDTRLISDGLRAVGSLRTPNSKLGTICTAVGVSLPADQAHDAMNDIRATRLAYYELRKKFMATSAWPQNSDSGQRSPNLTLAGFGRLAKIGTATENFGAVPNT